MKIGFPAGIARHIAVFDDAIPDQLCESLWRECDRSIEAMEPGRTHGGFDVAMKTSLDLPLVGELVEERSPGLWDRLALLDYEIRESLIPVVGAYIESYKALHTSALMSDTSFQVQRYVKGLGYYREHVDDTPWWSTGDHRRVFAVVMYLNTVSHGGGTRFPLDDVIIDAVQGRVAVFPAAWTHPHQGLVPISSDKWIISTFITAEPLS